MNYIKRHSEITLKRLEGSFPVVLVTGPRQVGKTTLLQKCICNKDTGYLTFDDPSNVASAREDAKTFLNLNKTPVVFDEIQYVPEIFSHIKIKVDTAKQKGMYYFTGSQQFHLMKNISESLAGRIGILNILGLSLRERRDDACYEPFIPTDEFIQKRNDCSLYLSTESIWNSIFEGSFPEIISGVTRPRDFYSNYVRTYIERDVRALSQVADELQFMNFIAIVASRTSQLLNYRDLSNEVGVSEPTAKKWLSILVTSGLVYLLQPYHNNIEKRVYKTPKMYFLDTGLVAYLTKWTSPEVIQNGAMAGAFFETFVVGEILKSYYNAGVEPSLYFYRDKDMKEIDLIFEQNGTLYPVEIKKKATPDKNDTKAFSALASATKQPIGNGAIVCMTDEIRVIQKNIYSIPISKI